MKKLAAVVGFLGLITTGAAGEVNPAHTAPSGASMASSTGLPGLLVASLMFTAADSNQDGLVTRAELKTTLEKWFAEANPAREGSISEAALIPVLNAAMPMASLAATMSGGGRDGAQRQTPDPLTVDQMMAALPDHAIIQPKQARQVLVLGRAAGFVHSTIPLAAKTIEALGTKTGAWSTTISYDAASITSENLRQYDAVVLASTTGAFLDEAGNPDATNQRRQALLDFVRSGKGLVGIHAASDSYHNATGGPSTADAARDALRSFTVGTTLAPVMLHQGDRNGDQKLSLTEVDELSDRWFDALDRKKTGKLLQSDFALFALLIPKASGSDVPPVAQGPDNQVGTWTDFNRLIGGYFKFHWLDPQLITVKIDDAKSPLTAMFKGREFEIHDEIYTMGINSWSRENVHVLTSIDFGKMNAEDKALEANPRADHDYGLSWIRREGQGRVFYEALGHSERIYAVKPILEHLLAGVQYAVGDLPADDSPSKAPSSP